MKKLSEEDLINIHIKYSFFKKPLKKYVPLSVPITYFFISGLLLSIPTLIAPSYGCSGFGPSKSSRITNIKEINTNENTPIESNK